MADLGAWSKQTYEIEMQKSINKRERCKIDVEKIKLEKREVELKLAEFDTRIQEVENKIEELNKNISWCKGKIKEKEENGG